MSHQRWCQQSVVFQAGALTLIWGYFVLLLAVMEYYSNHTPFLQVVAIASALFAAGGLITIVWPWTLVKKLRNPEFKGDFSMLLWIFIGLLQLPFGTILAVFQGWCLWRLQREQKAPQTDNHH